MLNFLIAMAVIFGLMMGWIFVQITEGANISDDLLIPGMDEMFDDEEELEALEIGL